MTTTDTTVDLTTPAELDAATPAELRGWLSGDRVLSEILALIGDDSDRAYRLLTAAEVAGCPVAMRSRLQSEVARLSDVTSLVPVERRVSLRRPVVLDPGWIPVVDDTDLPVPRLAGPLNFQRAEYEAAQRTARAAREAVVWLEKRRALHVKTVKRFHTAIDGSRERTAEVVAKHAKQDAERAAAIREAVRCGNPAPPVTAAMAADFRAAELVAAAQEGDQATAELARLVAEVASGVRERARVLSGVRNGSVQAFLQGCSGISAASLALEVSEFAAGTWIPASEKARRAA